MEASPIVELLSFKFMSAKYRNWITRWLWHEAALIHRFWTSKSRCVILWNLINILLSMTNQSETELIDICVKIFEINQRKTSVFRNCSLISKKTRFWMETCLSASLWRVAKWLFVFNGLWAIIHLLSSATKMCIDEEGSANLEGFLPNLPLNDVILSDNGQIQQSDLDSSHPPANFNEIGHVS